MTPVASLTMTIHCNFYTISVAKGMQKKLISCQNLLFYFITITSKIIALSEKKLWK